MSTPILVSCADSAFPKLSHNGALDVIKDLGIDGVDVFVLSGSAHTSAEAVLEDAAAAAATVGTRLEQRGLRIADVFAIFGESFETFAPNHPDEAVRDESLRQFRALVDFGRRLQAPGLTILPGTPFDGIPDDQSFDRAVAVLEHRAEIAGEAGLRLAVEPHFDSIIPTPAETLALLERTENVGITLDLSHFAYLGIDQAESDPLIPRTRHVHLRQARPDVMQARAREGTIDFPRLRDALLADGYDGYFGLEYQWEEHWLDFTRVDCITETVELRDLLLSS